ncbi:Protein tyrosine kinase [Phytophthora infestans]|uniref:Protein tyrosine kinase n=1 Tax=Phytophthora infestans TaxID=4787 RepID=A0A833WPM8_PHYIN|nr:Protein tyrosine kinase [Phytophthora infestans]
MRANSKTRTCSSAHLRWRAPECLTRRPTFASDVYSLAMCMIEASAGEPPFAFLDDDDVRETLKSGVVPEKPQEMSDQVWELVVSMTHADPSKRVELTLVIDTLKTLATEDLGDGGVTRCIVCTALVLDYSRSVETSWDFKTNRPRAVGRRHTSHLPSVVVELDATSSIVDLVAVLRSGSIDEQESAVLLLLQACICDHTRQQMQQENGLSALEDLVKTGRTHLLQVCALGCLCWSCELDSTPPDAEFEALQETIGAPTESECASLAQMLRNNDHDTLRTVMYCACAAGANGRRQLFNAGVVPPLVTLLGSGNEALTIWTMDALGSLACDGEARSAIVAEGAIPVLVELLKNGSETQRGFAACVLGQLSADSAFNSATVVESGAIPFLVGLLRAQATIPKNFAVFALDGIAAVRDEYGVAIARNGGIPRLIRLLRTGTSRQKKLAACVLGWLANQDENRLEIARRGAIADLVTLLRSGTQNQRESAAFALSFLAMDRASGAEMTNSGAIAPLVALLRDGTQEQKEHAVCTLGSLADSHQDHCRKIVDARGIGPLLSFLRTRNMEQKGLAAQTLGCIATSSEEHRREIISGEVIELLVDLIRCGSQEERDKGMFALCYVTNHGRADTRALASKTIISRRTSRNISSSPPLGGLRVLMSARK